MARTIFTSVSVSERTYCFRSNVRVYDVEAWKRALACAKGCFQVDLLCGVERLSLATLRGKARQYQSRYALSIHNLLCRLSDARIPFGEEKSSRGRRILTIG